LANVELALGVLRKLKVEYVCFYTILTVYRGCWDSLLDQSWARDQTIRRSVWAVFCISRYHLLPRCVKISSLVDLLVGVLVLVHDLYEEQTSFQSLAGGEQLQGVASNILKVVQNPTSSAIHTRKEVEKLVKQVLNVSRQITQDVLVERHQQLGDIHLRLCRSHNSEVDVLDLYDDPELAQNFSRLQNCSYVSMTSSIPNQFASSLEEQNKPSQVSLIRRVRQHEPTSYQVHTPIARRAVAPARWLHNVVGIRPSVPSTAKLKQHLQACGIPNFAAKLHNRAVTFVAVALQWSATGQATNILQKKMNNQIDSRELFDTNIPKGIIARDLILRQKETLQLYYYALELILSAELQGRKHVLPEEQPRISSVVLNMKFHRSILCLCIEIIAEINQCPILRFPEVLEYMHIKAFDLCMALEPFIQSEPSLPGEIKKHLRKIETSIIHSYAFQRDSSLFRILHCARVPIHNCSSTCARKDPATATQDCFDLPSPRTSRWRLSAFSVVQTPKFHEEGDVLPLAFGHPESSCPPGCDETSHKLVGIFLTDKVLRLAVLRCTDLCERLHLSPTILQQILHTISHVIYQHTHMLYNRHLDQIMLCATYGVCKVNIGLDVKFRDIIIQYKKQPQSSNDVVRSVVLDQSKDAELRVNLRGDIIEFYNRVFIHDLQSFLVDLPRAAPYKNYDYIQDSNSFKVDSSCGLATYAHHLHVAPMGKHESDTVSATRRTFYAFVGESTQAYQSPGQDLSFINCQVNRDKVDMQGSQLGLEHISMEDAASAVAAAAVSSFSRISKNIRNMKEIS